MSEELLFALLNKIKNVSQIKLEKVSQLPESGNHNIIYLLPRQDNGYEMWIYDTHNEWVDLGKEEVNLDGYATLDQLITVRNLIYVETQSRNENVRQLTNAINEESERAQGVEEDLNGILNNHSLSIEDLGSSYNELTNEVNELENEVADLDVCIEERLWGNGESGYRKYRKGCLVQWGTTTSNAGGEQEFQMHTTNTNQVFMLQVTPKEKGNFFSYGYPTANNKFACRIQDKDGTSRAIKFSWMSIGRWK